MTSRHIRKIALDLQSQGKTIKKTARATYLLSADRCELIVLRRRRMPSGVILDSQKAYSY